ELFWPKLRRMVLAQPRRGGLFSSRVHTDRDRVSNRADITARLRDRATADCLGISYVIARSGSMAAQRRDGAVRACLWVRVLFPAADADRSWYSSWCLFRPIRGRSTNHAIFGAQVLAAAGTTPFGDAGAPRFCCRPGHSGVIRD